MFLGTYTPRMDEKGRLILPAKYREELADGLVLTRGQERCIYVFSAEEFQNVHQQMRQAPLTSRQARDYIRVFLSGASDETPDKQGRVTISRAQGVRGAGPRGHGDRRGRPRRDLGHRGVERIPGGEGVGVLIHG